MANIRLQGSGDVNKEERGNTGPERGKKKITHSSCWNRCSTHDYSFAYEKTFFYIPIITYPLRELPIYATAGVPQKGYMFLGRVGWGGWQKCWQKFATVFCWQGKLRVFTFSISPSDLNADLVIYWRKVTAPSRAFAAALSLIHKAFDDFVLLALLLTYSVIISGVI